MNVSPLVYWYGAPIRWWGGIGSNPVWATGLRIGAVVSSSGHNPKVRGANPLSATKNNFQGYSLQIPIVRYG